jgi:acetyl-CoA acyltransferase
MKEAVIVSAVRSAVGKGKKDGALANVHPTELSACVMRGALEAAKVDAATVEDIFWGCAMPEASQGLNVARLSSLRAGIPVEVPSATINRFCSSGLQTVALAAQEIMCGNADVVMAGGVEMMSQVPMSGYHTRLSPELTESYIGMGFTAERVAERWKVSREEQDRWAFESQQKATRAWGDRRRSCPSPRRRCGGRARRKLRNHARSIAMNCLAPRQRWRASRSSSPPSR